MAQLVEQLIRNEQAVGSSPTTSLIRKLRRYDICGAFCCPGTYMTTRGVYRIHFALIYQKCHRPCVTVAHHRSTQ